MKINNKKLQPYFRSLTGKSRLMVYLLATGNYTVDELRKLTVSELNAVVTDVPNEFDLTDICRELTHNRDKSEKVLINASGRAYSVSNLIDVLKLSHKIAGMEYQGLEVFIKIVSKKR